jgi:non-canonical (house-cleaning) NTP pyrophosphatase
MKIGVTSQNKLKMGAVEKAYATLGIPIEVVGYKADSGVGEQPVDDQTLDGARNRITDVNSQADDLDRIVSIENGIFREGEQWLDKAVVLIYDPQTDQEHIGYSDAVVFPNEFVERARQIGFDTMTVGQVMDEAGYVANQKDPHLSISGISRQVYLESTVQKLVDQVEKRG